VGLLLGYSKGVFPFPYHCENLLRNSIELGVTVERARASVFTRWARLGDFSIALPIRAGLTAGETLLDVFPRFEPSSQVGELQQARTLGPSVETTTASLP
jgi:hypothetical protein